MLKKRIIFTLLYQDKNFFLSRNFNLQKIGSLEWLKKNYNFTLMAKSVDEILLLDVSRKKQNINEFCSVIKSLTKNCFIPIAVGGKIESLDKAKKYIDSGADKLVINSKLFLNKKLLENIAKVYGEQCIIGSIDYKRDENSIRILINNGSSNININFKKALKSLINLPIGEVILNSIDRDGTGNGFDFKILEHVPNKFIKPIIFSGGAGNYKHFILALKNKKIDAVATANLLNFVGSGLQDVRKLIINQGFELSEWI
tara:strand:- start:4276 stop:5046 length:771 start_codon:yes stop_codon:yes gene_type:complete